MTMQIAMMVAAAENGVIGRDNRMPWHLPEDLRYFKQTTMGKPVIMGRKTFESIGRPLPGRTNIVLSRQHDLQLPDGVKKVQTVQHALQLAEEACKNDAIDEVMVIGGEEIYRLFMPQATRLYLTCVHASVEGDARFPWQPDQWRVLSEEHHAASGDNPYDYSFCVLEKR